MIDTSFEEGEKIGYMAGLKDTVIHMNKEGLNPETISGYTGSGIDEIKRFPGL